MTLDEALHQRDQALRRVDLLEHQLDTALSTMEVLLEKRKRLSRHLDSALAALEERRKNLLSASGHLALLDAGELHTRAAEVEVCKALVRGAGVDNV